MLRLVDDLARSAKTFGIAECPKVLQIRVFGIESDMRRTPVLPTVVAHARLNLRLDVRRKLPERFRVEQELV